MKAAAKIHLGDWFCASTIISLTVVHQSTTHYLTCYTHTFVQYHIKQVGRRWWKNVNMRMRTPSSWLTRHVLN